MLFFIKCALRGAIGNEVFYNKMNGIDCCPVENINIAHNHLCSAKCDFHQKGSCIGFSAGESSCELCIACTHQAFDQQTNIIRNMFSINFKHYIDDGKMIVEILANI